MQLGYEKIALFDSYLVFININEKTVGIDVSLFTHILTKCNIQSTICALNNKNFYSGL